MITEEEQPVWFDYIELDNDLNQRLRADAPEDVKEAYEQHLKELAELDKTGTFVYKA